MKFLHNPLTILLLGTSLLGASGVATLTAKKGSVSIQNPNATLEATLGATLEEQDHIITGDKSKAQIIFSDETVVTIGKNSDFSIAKYVYETDQNPEIEMGLVKGAMSTISGKIGKLAPERFSVKTKTATIGIRGTNFTVLVSQDGTQNVYCTYGAISVTFKNQEFRVEQGFHISISPSGEVSIVAFDATALAEMKKSNFQTPRPLQGDPLDATMEGSAGTMLDNTTQAYADLLIRDLSDEMQDSLQTANAFANLIDSYTLNSVLYHGTSMFVDPIEQISTEGLATLEVNFGYDSAQLTLTDIYDNVTEFSSSSLVGSSFTMQQITSPAGGFQNKGSATGVFQEPTGNSVTGNFSIDDGYGYFQTGSYTVTTQQTLH